MTGDRNDWKGDLAELFGERRRTRGAVYATRRLIVDALSLAIPRPRLDSIAQDIRHAFRLFRRHAAIVSLTVAGLGLAIAVCTSVFTILNATVIRQYGMDDPRSVVRIDLLFKTGSSNGWPYSAFARMRESATQLDIAATYKETVRFGLRPSDVSDRPDDLLLVSGNYLPMLGGRAALGRTLQPSDDVPGAPAVVVLNHAFWKNHLGADRTIVGKTVWLLGRAVTVAGVITPSFTGPEDQPPSFWAPFASYSAIFGDRAIDRSSGLGVDLVGRIRAGGSSAAAESELTAIAAALPDELPAGPSNPREKVTGARLTAASSPMSGPDGGSLALVVAMIFLGVGLVLALACTNVASLLLAGASSRAKEISMRLALGASPGRIVRQLLSESLLIGMSAASLGLLGSLWLVPAATSLVGFPQTFDARPDATVLIFTVVIGIISGVGAGLSAARHGSRSDLVVTLKSEGGGAGTSRKAAGTRRWFVGFQAGASILLLVIASLFTRAAINMTRIDVGFDQDRLVTMAPAFPRAGFAAAETAAYWRAALDKLGSVPGVERASLAKSPPFSGQVSMISLNRDGGNYVLYENRTDASYFETTGLRVVRGRPYTPDEVSGHARVAVISESIARDFFKGQEPVGASMAGVFRDLSGVTIIGVVNEALTDHVRGRGDGTIYRPIEPSMLGDARLVIRSTMASGSAHDIERALTAVDPRVRPEIRVMHDDVQKVMNEPRILAMLSGSVAMIAVMLAVLGIYGVTAFVAGQRTQEVGVRMAIGASAGDVVRLLIRQNAAPVVAGLTVGLAIALAGARVLTSALSGISPYDPLAIVPPVVVLGAAAIAAIAVPTIRASRTDPASVLRQ